MRGVVFNTDGLFVAHDISRALRVRQWEVVEAADEIELLAIVRDAGADLIAIEAEPPQPGLAIARRVREVDRRTLVVLVVSSCDSDFAIAAMRAGVNDVLTARRGDADIAAVLGRVSLGEPRRALCAQLIASDRLVGRSKSVDEVRHSIQRVAACDSNVLITGETGTGKELTAELIHCNSRRRDRPFVSINCAAIPDGLLESELFGYERGAFTGAHAAREGKLQYAHGGTLFLDEVGDMSLYAQAKILRAIESRKVQRLGANRDVAVNIRIIAATNHNLEQLTSQQKFRQDLYFRLNVARLHLPPLREHAEDIPELVRHVVAELSPRLERRVDAVDATFLEPLRRYAWPGNVRELRNIVESTLVFCASDRITDRDLPPYLRALFASERRKDDSERTRIAGALGATNWNRNDTARLLGCSRMTLYRKMVKYGLLGAGAEGIGECEVGA